VSVLTVLLLLGGFVALIAGGESLVRGASGLARALGMSPLIVGLTVVAAATSAPELAVTVDASLSGSPGIALGNVVGSNIANVLLVLGASALVLPLAVSSQPVRADIPVLAGASILMLVLALDGSISRVDGLVLFLLVVVYVTVLVVVARRRGGANGAGGLSGFGELDAAVPQAPAPADGPEGDAAAGRKPLLRDIGFIVVGVGLLVLGARWLVRGATEVAQSFGVSDLVIGLTVVAIGTSLPEMATSVMAAVRGEREMAGGNVAGSNIFNLGMVLGLAAIIAPGGVPVGRSAIVFDIPFMVAVALAMLPVAFTGFAISRMEGGVFVAYYVAYTAFLLLAAAEHDALEPFSAVMAGFVAPITVGWILVLAVYEFGVRRGRAAARRELGLPAEQDPS
jgi:cation:H+ antiporter